MCVLVGAVPYSGPLGFGSAEDDLRRAGVSKGRFERCKERGAKKTLIGADTHRIKLIDWWDEHSCSYSVLVFLYALEKTYGFGVDWDWVCDTK